MSASEYYALRHPNPNAVRRGYPGFWGYPSMKYEPSAIVLHTTESLADLNGPDSGAENVANWFQTNDTFALYHTLVDSDSTIRMVPAGLNGTVPYTAFHCAGYNSWTLGVSMALQAASWPGLPADYRDRILGRAAAEVVLLCQRWYLPAIVRSKAEIDAGLKGITGHGILDPSYRSDPGSGFPWGEFIKRVTAPAHDPALPEDDMPDYLMQLRDQTICAVYPNGQARPLGGGEYKHLIAKGLVTVQSAGVDEDDRLRTYAFMG